MKKICLMLCVLITAVFMVSCAEKESPLDTAQSKDIVEAVLDVTVHPESEKYYLKSENNMDTYSMSLWADGLFQECSEYGLIDDYAIYVSAGTTTYEIAVLRCEEKNDLSVLKNLVERRKGTLSLGDKGIYDKHFKKRMSDSKILSGKNTVVLLITDDNAAAIKAVNELE